MELKQSKEMFDVAPLKFWDNATKQEMMYVYPDTKHWCAGWLLYRAKHGGWVTLRKATGEDIEQLSAAVISGHHEVGRILSGK